MTVTVGTGALGEQRQPLPSVAAQLPGTMDAHYSQKQQGQQQTPTRPRRQVRQTRMVWWHMRQTRGKCSFQGWEQTRFHRSSQEQQPACKASPPSFNRGGEVVIFSPSQRLID